MCTHTRRPRDARVPLNIAVRILTLVAHYSAMISNEKEYFSLWILDQ